MLFSLRRSQREPRKGSVAKGSLAKGSPEINNNTRFPATSSSAATWRSTEEMARGRGRGGGGGGGGRGGGSRGGGEGGRGGGGRGGGRGAARAATPSKKRVAAPTSASPATVSSLPAPSAAAASGTAQQAKSQAAAAFRKGDFVMTIDDDDTSVPAFEDDDEDDEDEDEDKDGPGKGAAEPAEAVGKKAAKAAAGKKAEKKAGKKAKKADGAGDAASGKKADMDPMFLFAADAALDVGWDLSSVLGSATVKGQLVRSAPVRRGCRVGRRRAHNACPDNGVLTTQRTSVEDKIARATQRAKADKAARQAAAREDEDDEDEDGSDGDEDEDEDDGDEDGFSDDDDDDDDDEDEDDDAEDAEDADDADQIEDTIRPPKALPASRGRRATAAAAAEDDEDEDDEDAVDEDKEARKRAYFTDAPEGGAAGSATFAAMNLSRPIMRALAELGFTTPTPIQGRTIPLALQGLDLCASAVTGSGTGSGAPRTGHPGRRALTLTECFGTQAKRLPLLCRFWSASCSGPATSLRRACSSSRPRANWPSSVTWSPPSWRGSPTSSLPSLSVCFPPPLHHVCTRRWLMDARVSWSRARGEQAVSPTSNRRRICASGRTS